MADTCCQLRMLAAFVGVKADFTTIEDASKTKIPVMKKKDGQGAIKGLASIAKSLAETSNYGKCVYSDQAATAALIDQWLEYKVTHLDRCANEKDLHTALQELDMYLSNRVYFVGCRLSLADLFLYYGLHSTVKDLTFHEKERFIHLSRWFNNVQHEDRVADNLSTITFQRNLLYA